MVVRKRNSKSIARAKRLKKIKNKNKKKCFFCLTAESFGGIMVVRKRFFKSICRANCPKKIKIKKIKKVSFLC
jgi:hypothetical protein